MSTRRSSTPVSLEFEGGEEPGTIRFSAFNEPVGAAPPPADRTLDISVLDG